MGQNGHNINELMKEFHCAKNFKCLEFKFDEMCKAKDIGQEDYLECLDPNAEQCEYSLSFAHGYLCQCSIRLHIKKSLKK